MNLLLAFDNDGVLRDESQSYQRCIAETVAFFDGWRYPTKKELTDSSEASNDDWNRTYQLLQQRGIRTDFEKVKEYFQDLYLGKKRDFTGYIRKETWLADNVLLEILAKKHHLVIVSGAPIEEIDYALKRNNARRFFSAIWGSSNCTGKLDGLEKAIGKFKAQKIFFCDDRPSPLKEVSRLKGKYDIEIYGIMPPNVSLEWSNTLLTAGALKVYSNVRDYCMELIDRDLKQN